MKMRRAFSSLFSFPFVSTQYWSFELPRRTALRWTSGKIATKHQIAAVAQHEATPMMDGRVTAAESQTHARVTKEVPLRPVDRQGWARCMSAANCLQIKSRQCEMSAMGPMHEGDSCTAPKRAEKFRRIDCLSQIDLNQGWL
jgi:hypothetical protein